MLPKTEFKTIFELISKFPNEKSCHQYLAAQRWEGYLICPFEGCGNDKAYVFSDGIRYKCTKCLKIYTAKTGTFMEGSKLSSIKWFIAMYLVLHKKGISSVQLAKDIGVTQKTAWFLLQRLRWAFGNEEAEQLEGVVEIDEAFCGGKQKNKHKKKRYKYSDSESKGRAWRDKTPVFGMLQRGGKVKAHVIPNVHGSTLRVAALRAIKGGTDIMADGYMSYSALEPIYNLQQVDHSKGYYVNGDVHTNGIENFWSHFKRGTIGIYIQISKKHLNKYVQEFVFRHNYRNLGPQQQINCIIKNMNCRLKYKDLIQCQK